MKDGNKKKSLLSIAVSLSPVTATMLANGRYVEGGILGAATVGLILGYDYLDDRMKGEPKAPSGVDSETVEDAAETIANEVNERRRDE